MLRWIQHEPAESRLGLTCKNCGYEHIDLQRAGVKLVTYCQQCGIATEEQSDLPHSKKWDHLSRAQISKSSNHTKAINHLIPLPDKKKKYR